MSELRLFKNKKQTQNDFWAELEKNVTGGFALEGFPKEIVPRVMERIRRVWDRCLATEKELHVSFQLQPIVRLTEDEAASLSKQCSDALSEHFPEIAAQFVLAVSSELASAEGQIYLLRKELGA